MPPKRGLAWPLQQPVACCVVGRLLHPLKILHCWASSAPFETLCCLVSAAAFGTLGCSALAAACGMLGCSTPAAAFGTLACSAPASAFGTLGCLASAAAFGTLGCSAFKATFGDWAAGPEGLCGRLQTLYGQHCGLLNAALLGCYLSLRKSRCFAPIQLSVILASGTLHCSAAVGASAI